MLIGHSNFYLLSQSASRIIDMKLNKRAAWIAVIAALPLVALASYSWIKAVTDKSVPTYEVYLFGDVIYLLGSPLTLLVLGLPFYAGRQLSGSDNWWAIPLVDFLFILQWVVWSQLISRRRRPKYS
jgi:hypothetical protein